MKLTIERAALLRSLGHVQSVVERRNTIPILSNVLVEAKAGRLSLTATDMDIAIVESLAAEVSGEGATTAPAHTLYEIVRRLPEGAQVELATGDDEGQLNLRSGRFKTRLACLPPSDFPVMSEGKLPHSFGLSPADMRSLIDRTRFAISTEETRYYLNGIYLHAAEQEGTPVLRAVATDGHRLARVQLPLPEGAKHLPGVIVPRKTVGELRKLIEEASDTILVSLSNTKIRFAFDGAVLTSKLIDGTFPDYERVIPAGNDKLLEVKCRDFTAAVDRVSAISTEKSRAIKLTLDQGGLTLSAHSPESGSAVEEIEVKYSDSHIEIGFNSRYLLDITQQIHGETARFVMADSTSPTVVHDSGDASALYVLMPMRV
ncbi:MAG: DNA polymerase III subunit beta [Proteobacteria bacterium]|nr:DNA polymerase III subunit beta [Pseudomonadota bacterium]